MRRKRWVLALQAVKRAAGIGGPGSPEAHCMVLRFCHAAQSDQVSRLARSARSCHQHGFHRARLPRIELDIKVHASYDMLMFQCASSLLHGEKSRMHGV